MLVSVTGALGHYSGWGTNLSQHGVFVNAPEAALSAATVGAVVDVILQLGQVDCKLKGRIVWAKPRGPGVADSGMGIEFVEPEPATRELLGKMMERLRADLTSA
jgi:Tfp pilus assembly protein PilZ